MKKKAKLYNYVTEERLSKAMQELASIEDPITEEETAAAKEWAAQVGLKRPDFNERFGAALAKSRRRERLLNRTLITGKCLLACMIIFLGSWFAQTEAVQSARTDIMDYFGREGRDKYVVKGVGTTVPEGWEKIYVPTYLPEGFKLVDSEETLIRYLLRYENDLGQYIDILQYGPNNTIDIYTETDQKIDSVILDNNCVAMVYEQNGSFNVVWRPDYGVIKIISDSLLDDIVKIANSMEWRE